MVRTVVVGTDGSPMGTAAVREAVDLARSAGARLHLVTAFRDPRAVVAPSEVLVPVETSAAHEHVDLRVVAENVLLRAGRVAQEAGVEFETHDREEDPADAIIEVAAEQDADLIVVGDRGLKGVTRFLLGSVSNKVVQHAPCSVMVVRSPSAAAQ
jgi:nucleotide-binding universal stress UspA family protein